MSSKTESMRICGVAGTGGRSGGNRMLSYSPGIRQSSPLASVTAAYSSSGHPLTLTLGFTTLQQPAARGCGVPGKPRVSRAQTPG